MTTFSGTGQGVDVKAEMPSRVVEEVVVTTADGATYTCYIPAPRLTEVKLTPFWMPGLFFDFPIPVMLKPGSHAGGHFPRQGGCQPGRHLFKAGLCQGCESALLSFFLSFLLIPPPVIFSGRKSGFGHTSFVTTSTFTSFT